MPSKIIYKIVFDEKNKNFEIQVTDEFGSPQTEYEFEPSATLESARRLLDDFKEKLHEKIARNPYREIVYISPDHFEIINHRD